MQKPDLIPTKRCTRAHLRRGIVACVSALLAASSAVAQSSAPEATRAAYFRAIADPAEARAELLVREGRARLEPALGRGLWRDLSLGDERPISRRAAAESALVRFERAVALAPTLPEAQLWLGKTLALLAELARDGAAYRARAIAVLEALDAHAPLYAAEDVATELALAYTRRGDLTAARTAYERALALRTGERDQATLLANLAELIALEGDLPRALGLYEQAIEEGDGGRRVLATWGAALVHDRLGDRAEALALTRRALQEDRAPMAALHQPGVFFVPPHELDYLEGLGHAALADAERAPGESRESLLSTGFRALASRTDASEVRALAAALRSVGDAAVHGAIAPLLPTLARAGAVSAAPRAGANTAPPDARAARAAVLTLRALVAFARFVQRDQGEGPFADAARAHVGELARALHGER